MGCCASRPLSEEFDELQAIHEHEAAIYGLDVQSIMAAASTAASGGEGSEPFPIMLRLPGEEEVEHMARASDPAALLKLQLVRASPSSIPPPLAQRLLFGSTEICDAESYGTHGVCQAAMITMSWDPGLEIELVTPSNGHMLERARSGLQQRQKLIAWPEERVQCCLRRLLHETGCCPGDPADGKWVLRTQGDGPDHEKDVAELLPQTVGRQVGMSHGSAIAWVSFGMEQDDVRGRWRLTENSGHRGRWRCAMV